MHEAGYALGMSDWSLLYFTVEGLNDAASWITEQVLPGLPEWAFELLEEDIDPPADTYSMSHPTIPDSVLNYDDKVKWDYDESSEEWERVENEPGCSPYPFDVMALYALYQTEAGEDD